jgi:hypothetical protein
MPSQIVTTFGSYETAPTQIVRLMLTFSLEYIAIGSVDKLSVRAIRLLSCAGGQKSGIPRTALAMNSRRTSPVGAITAPA